VEEGKFCSNYSGIWQTNYNWSTFPIVNASSGEYGSKEEQKRKRRPWLPHKILLDTCKKQDVLQRRKWPGKLVRYLFYNHIKILANIAIVLVLVNITFKYHYHTKPSASGVLIMNCQGSMPMPCRRHCHTLVKLQLHY